MMCLSNEALSNSTGWASNSASLHWPQVGALANWSETTRFVVWQCGQTIWSEGFIGRVGNKHTRPCALLQVSLEINAPHRQGHCFFVVFESAMYKSSVKVQTALLQIPLIKCGTAQTRMPQVMSTPSFESHHHAFNRVERKAQTSIPAH